MPSIIIPVIAFLLSVCTIPLVMLFARKFSLYDTVDERKVHTGNIPRLGGLSILIGFSASIILLICNGDFLCIEQRIWTLLIAVLLIMAMGIIDDIITLRARYKLYTQILATLIVLAGGFVFKGFHFAPANINLNFGIFGYVLTFCWIIGVTNAINLIDGIDGLCGSICVIACLTYTFFFRNYANHAAMYICFSLAAAICGFLVYNLPLPHAKIFMGDGGSQFLGFTLAVLPLINISGTVTSIQLPFCALILMIPLFDTVAAIWRRIREHRKIDSPDKYHLHHKLMMLGFSSVKTLLLIVLFQTIISLFTVLMIWIDGTLSLVLYLTVGLMGIFFFTVIHVAKTRIGTHGDQS